MDHEKYVSEASRKADAAKLAHRSQLKESQKLKEEQADANGAPLTAKDKERERSRRESAVTRKRAEVYIQELENTARMVPNMEKYLSILVRYIQQELSRPNILSLPPRAHQPSHERNQGMRRRDTGSAQPNSAVQHHHQHHDHEHAGIPSVSELPIKTEPGVILSPSSAKTTNVMSGIKQLDL